VADACKALEQKIDAADIAIEALPKSEVGRVQVDRTLTPGWPRLVSVLDANL